MTAKPMLQPTLPGTDDASLLPALFEIPRASGSAEQHRRRRVCDHVPLSHRRQSQGRAFLGFPEETLAVLSVSTVLSAAMSD